MRDETFEQQFNHWMTRMNEREHPSPDIVAFNFGLFETIEGFTIYLIGAKKYDPENDDWATEPDFEPDPENEYLEINPGETEHLQPDDVLQKATDVVKRYLASSVFDRSFLKHAQVITIGFDDGSLSRIR